MMHRTAAATAVWCSRIATPTIGCRTTSTAPSASQALTSLCRTFHTSGSRRLAAPPAAQSSPLTLVPREDDAVLPSFSEERALNTHRETHSYTLPDEPASVVQIFGKMSINWYPGHMHSAKLALQERVAKCHLVLEVRDARIPFSSGNPDFSSLLGAKKRILVFNKSDLADPASFPRVRAYFQARGQECIFMAGDPVVEKSAKRRHDRNQAAAAAAGGGGGGGVSSATEDRDRKVAISHAVNRTQLKQLQALIQTALFPRKFSTVPPVLLVVGFPNVGKSTLINAFRAFSKSAAATNAGKSYLDTTKEDTKKMQKGGVAKVGAEPGVTRGITGFLVSTMTRSGNGGGGDGSSTSKQQQQQTDKLFLLDTPGIMLPYLPSTPVGVALGLKLSAVNSIADLVLGEEALVRYTLWTLNRAQQFAYVQMLHPHLTQPTSDLAQLLMAIYRKKHPRTVHKSDLFKRFEKFAQERQTHTNTENETEPTMMDESDDMQEAEVAKGSDDHRVAPHLSTSTPSSSLEAATTTSAAAASSSPASGAPPVGPQSISGLTSEELYLCTSWWIKTFRRGEFGRLTLDHIPTTPTGKNKSKT